MVKPATIIISEKVSGLF